MKKQTIELPIEWIEGLRSYIDNVKKTTTNESVVIISAVRYMLGRSSYGVGSVCDFLRENKGRLTESNKQVIIQDIKEYINDFPDVSYKNDWNEIADYLQKH